MLRLAVSAVTRWGQTDIQCRGGYYNGAYYPSVNNMFCPANNPENQINMPAFFECSVRMLFMLMTIRLRIIIMMEYQPLSPYGIRAVDLVWVDWFMKETFCGSGISIQYTQAGQGK